MITEFLHRFKKHCSNDRWWVISELNYGEEVTDPRDRWWFLYFFPGVILDDVTIPGLSFDARPSCEEW
jgi:hypothetical protein